ncbi:hypothetical protein KAR91_69135 [Candidatus Pacearchaeota archaeon]|nr:hypothetical protein [Candidatus Pacearchaeota archaeon]
MTWSKWQYLQKRKHMKQWEPVNDESRLKIGRNGSIGMIGGWRTRNTLRRKVLRAGGKPNVRILKRGVISFALAFMLLYVIDNPLTFIGLLGAAFTSKASGDWDANPTWNEVGSPGAGDTAQINNTHTVRIDNGTGNEACKSVDIQTGGTLTIDSEGAGALSFTFDNVAGAGFISTSGGVLNCVGTVGNGVTITNAAPNTFPWDNDWFLSSLILVADYTTFSFMRKFGGMTGAGAIDVDNCTFTNSQAIGFFIPSAASIASFDNNTFDNCSTGLSVGATIVINNLVITNSTNDMTVTNSCNPIEFINSNFDETNVTYSSNLGFWISKNHKDVAGEYFVGVGSGDTASVKSSITNDFTSVDNVTVCEGELICDEATAHNDLTIKSGGTLDVNPNITQTITNTGTITVENGGTLEWTGSAGNLITLVSDAPGTQWSLVNNGTVNVSYVDVTDSDASGGDPIDATDGTSVGQNQNNVNWLFTSAAGQKSFNFGFTNIFKG